MCTTVAVKYIDSCDPAVVDPSAVLIIKSDLRLSGLLESRSGKLKIKQKLCRRRDVHEGLFHKRPSIDLIYERTTVCECGPIVLDVPATCSAMLASSGVHVSRGRVKRVLVVVISTFFPRAARRRRCRTTRTGQERGPTPATPNNPAG